ncbi:MAG: BolA family transcriptional regulator [Rhodospirillales bacterium]|nr:MAG: BolA family transcriptional regulator [Rhodospirillales bacterium]
MVMADTIREKLTRGLAPMSLEVIDESHRHTGHAGARPGGETHFRVRIVATAFEGVSRLDRHRMVHDILAAELADRVHALNVSARTPGEDTAAS